MKPRKAQKSNHPSSSFAKLFIFSLKEIILIGFLKNLLGRLQGEIIK